MSSVVGGAADLRERVCIHRKLEMEGQFYTGEAYVASLQRLRSEAAVSMARKVGAFFWSDAALMRVWLCRNCAVEAGL